MRLAETVTFGGGGLDRAAHIRRDNDALAHLLSTPDARILPMWRSKPLVQGGDALVLAPVPDRSLLRGFFQEVPFFLGKADGAAWFAQDVSSWEPEGQDTATVGAFVDPTEQHFPDLPEDCRFVELRAVMARLSPLDAELAATARALIEWHRAHRFCARCGAGSTPVEAGWQRKCTTCGRLHFPRTDPVVIMLITHGNSVLMGRSPGWPEGMFSLLAGFVEPGETLEAAVRREVFEEAGVSVGAVSYLASQPWPFPASLMIGCRGDALTRDICVDPAEIEEALWVSREEMLSVMAGDHATIRTGREGAIARFLLSNWLADRLD
ncbi:NAD(+) diphosphatase [Tropicimonas marinistellae]|uniref:NAD(+) diphosphatase n=1 Tax=Tropicimonas marinistellae TaxID=1739787 RepID=UPI000834C1C4|nr:NAD(+) diphosphatase [Tropicimonas marinistellae]